MNYESESYRSDGSSNDSMGNPSLNSITLGDWLRGNLSLASDVDYFKFTAVAGLLNVQLQTPEDSVLRWRVELFDLNGDYVRTFSRSVVGSYSATKSGTTGSDVEVSGLTGPVPLGSKFTITSADPDTKIYTVLGATALVGGKSVLTLDSAFSASTAQTIAFDPAQFNASGGDSHFSALIDQTGGYYLKVSPISWTDVTYAINLKLQPSGNDPDSLGQDTKALLVPNLTHQGAVNSVSDKSDVWYFTSATASNFSFDFSPGNSESTFNLQLQAWDAVNAKWSDARAANGSLLNVSNISGAKSFAIDKTVYPSGTSFALTVTSSALASATNSGRYSLKASGVGLDANDTPVVLVDGHSASEPNSTLDLTLDDAVVRTYRQGNDAKVALASLFSASDADAGQTLTYKAWLSDESGGSDATIKVGDSSYDGSFALTAAQLQNAFVYTGNHIGDTTLIVQAIDSSQAADGSGDSAYVMQTLRVVPSDVAVLVAGDISGGLVEGGSAKTINLKLGDRAPTQDVSVYIVQDDPQFELSSSVLVFKAGVASTENGYYKTEQVLSITAKSDGKTEGSHASAVLKFQVVSQDPNYKGLAIDSLTFTISDPANRPHTGTLTLSDNPAQGGVVTVSSTVFDPDGEGRFIYTWQRASAADAAQWQDIADATEAQYTPTASDVGKYLRVKVAYTDALGYAESETSAASNVAVIKTNDAPTTQDHEINLARMETYTFTEADFPFMDADAQDALSVIALLNLPLNGQFKINNETFSVPDGGFLISADELKTGALTFTPDASKTGTVSDVVSFKVFDSHDAESLLSGDLLLTASSRPSSSNAVVDGLKNTPIILDLADFAFSDADVADTLQAVRIIELPKVGQLKLSGANVNSNQLVSAADIAAGKLTFAPVNEAFSKDYDHLKFKVSDGLVESAAVYDLNFRVAKNSDGSFGQDLTGHMTYWKSSVPVVGASIPVGLVQTVTTGNQGEFALTGVDLPSTTTVTPRVDAPLTSKTDAGITLTDVLATLKVYLGRELPSDYASPFNVVAADFNADGVVNLTDVLGLLKYYLGRPTEAAPAWTFVDAGDVVSDNGITKIMGASGNYISKSDVNLDPIHVSPDQATPVEIIGVIRGDVDGSWAAVNSA